MAGFMGGHVSDKGKYNFINIDFSGLIFFFRFGSRLADPLLFTGGEYATNRGGQCHERHKKEKAGFPEKAGGLF